jgi:opacity protein-like surface antigen
MPRLAEITVTSRSTVALAALLLAASPAAAQSLQRWSVQGSAAVIAPVSVPEGLDSDIGLGFDAQLRYTFSRWSLGAGYQRSNVYNASASDLTIALSLGFLEPRYVVFAGGPAAGYLAGRLGAGQLVCSRDRCDDTWHFVVGGGGGLLFKLSDRLSVDLGGQYFVVTDASSSDYATARLGLGVGL